MAALAAALALPAAAGALDESGFRYVRELRAEERGLAMFEPDGPLFAHARPGLADLRILDARGQQVPWRPLPTASSTGGETVRVLNRGRRGRYAVALLDLGRSRRVHDRVVVRVPARDFVARVEVLGSDDREAFTRLGATTIYDVRGARRARSTAVEFPPSDFRYLELRAAGIPAILGATVSSRATRPRLVDRRLRLRVSQRGARTVATADLGFRRLPVDELDITARTPRYLRPVEIAGSNDGRTYVPLAAARIARFPGSSQAPIAVGAEHRYLRISIDNGDDRPLAGLRVAARARSRAVLVAAAPPPLRLLYGNPRQAAPEYDFARLPASALGVSAGRRVTHTRVSRATLGRERLNPRFEPPDDTRSFAARHPSVVQGALAFAAVVLAAAAFLALRRRA